MEKKFKKSNGVRKKVRLLNDFLRTPYFYSLLIFQ